MMIFAKYLLLFAKIRIKELLVFYNLSPEIFIL